MRNVFNFYLQVNAAAARQVQIKGISHSTKKKETRMKICKKAAQNANFVQQKFVMLQKNC